MPPINVAILSYVCNQTPGEPKLTMYVALMEMRRIHYAC